MNRLKNLSFAHKNKLQTVFLVFIFLCFFYFWSTYLSFSYSVQRHMPVVILDSNECRQGETDISLSGEVAYQLYQPCTFGGTIDLGGLEGTFSSRTLFSQTSIDGSLRGNLYTENPWTHRREDYFGEIYTNLRFNYIIIAVYDDNKPTFYVAPAETEQEARALVSQHFI